MVRTIRCITKTATKAAKSLSFPSGISCQKVISGVINYDQQTFMAGMFPPPPWLEIIPGTPFGVNVGNKGNGEIYIRIRVEKTESKKYFCNATGSEIPESIALQYHPQQPTADPAKQGILTMKLSSVVEFLPIN